MTTFDDHKNFAYSTVATAPSPASSGLTLVVQAGEGTRFPAVPFNAVVWPQGQIPIVTNATIIRVTGISTDTLTFTRQTEGSANRSIVVGDQIGANITDKTLTDIEDAINSIATSGFPADGGAPNTSYVGVAKIDLGGPA